MNPASQSLAWPAQGSLERHLGAEEIAEIETSKQRPRFDSLNTAHRSIHQRPRYPDFMNTTLINQPAAQSGTFLIGGEIPVHRLGFGTMRLTGKGIWGEPDDHDECIAVLRRALELGITLIDTADSYGPFVSEELIAEALHPYPENLLIATKAGLQPPGPDERASGG